MVRATATDWDGFLESESSRELELRFGDLVRRQSHFVFRLAYSVVRDAAEAEDVVQETFLKLFKNRSWLNVQDERAFLARTACRIAISRKRKNTAAIAERQMSTTPETTAIESQRTRQLHALIEALPEKLRGPLVLSALQELTTAQVAAALDEPEGTVRRRVSEARALLKEKMERMSKYVRRT